MIRSINTFDTIGATGQVQVKLGIRIQSCSDRDGEITEIAESIIDNLPVIGPVLFRGVTEIMISYVELTDQWEREIPPRNDLDNRIVVPMDWKDDYILTLNPLLYPNLKGYARMERRAYLYLLKYI